MSSKNKWTIIVFLAVGVLAVTSLAWTVVSNRRTARKYEQAYPQIKLGDSKESVVNLMGEPTTMTDCVFPWFADEKREAEYRSSCKKLYIYEVFPVDYTISFDKKGKVINKTTAVSP
jgi:hypothetical protein